MTTVLGISAYYHDSAAALLVDGKIASAVQEERLSRIKGDPALPIRAAKWCLQHSGISPADIDRVVFYENPFLKVERILEHSLAAFPHGRRMFTKGMQNQLGSKLWVLDQLTEALGVPRKRVTFCEHHLSHAASAFYASPFTESAILTVDGLGERVCVGLWHGTKEGIRKVEEMRLPHSLGLLYSAITAFLGFKVNEGEYKVMGLASYGTPNRRQAFSQLVTLNEDGSFLLNTKPFDSFANSELAYGEGLTIVLGNPRPIGKPWDLSSQEDQNYANIAATLQDVLEEAMLGLAKRAHRATKSSKLCIAGGVGLNAVSNARTLKEGPFERVFVQPAAGDAGGALGAAYLHAKECGDTLQSSKDSFSFGPEVSASRLSECAKALGLSVSTLADPMGTAAERIEESKIIAFVNGRAEWGPRALGQRSILATPTDVGMREKINKRIKGRELFRPLAPAVLESHASQYFEDAPNDMTATMTTTCPVNSKGKNDLPATTHIDGSARVQTVDHATPFGELLIELSGKGHPAVLLNTSLNGPGEPIATFATDVLSVFVSYGLDAIIAGDLEITR